MSEKSTRKLPVLEKLVRRCSGQPDQFLGTFQIQGWLFFMPNI